MSVLRTVRLSMESVPESSHRKGDFRDRTKSKATIRGGSVALLKVLLKGKDIGHRHST